MRTARTTTALLVALAAAGAANAERVSIEHDAASPQASYAARRLGEALREGGHEVRLTNFFVANDRNLFHWALVREEVAADVAPARAARAGE